MSSCCKTGFKWDGKPVGTESTIAGLKTYTTGSNENVAILIVADIFGWTLTNARLLADHYAKEADATVYIPDFYDGEVIGPEMLEDPEKAKEFDLMAWVGRHNKEIRGPAIFAAAKEIRSKYKKVGAIGFCYGGWAVFQLAGKGNNLIDCVSTAHPSLLDKSEITNLGVPTQIIAPENDFTLTPELKTFCNEEIPKLGIDYAYEYFPGLTHGFATRGDPTNKLQKDGLERAKNAAVSWFLQYLHGTK
ncbi:hypothetical protein LTR84_006210 [Exophiala bonariae]|uniref:Dienelactone hydrolase domain-containing protein n=1 Tax=Exophiala bonariae TaxID=1690606 RepID=A0AAV9N1V4_9EURO|nr:hypothetical protein LTR84_006210 [Exophiala bonariae]